MVVQSTSINVLIALDRFHQRRRNTFHFLKISKIMSFFSLLSLLVIVVVVVNGAPDPLQIENTGTPQPCNSCESFMSNEGFELQQLAKKLGCKSINPIAITIIIVFLFFVDAVKTDTLFFVYVEILAIDTCAALCKSKLVHDQNVRVECYNNCAPVGIDLFLATLNKLSVNATMPTSTAACGEIGSCAPSAQPPTNVLGSSFVVQNKTYEYQLVFRTWTAAAKLDALVMIGCTSSPITPWRTTAALDSAADAGVYRIHLQRDMAGGIDGAYLMRMTVTGKSQNQSPTQPPLFSFSEDQPFNFKN
jgi:hypothetical protein